jgi:hypothetical protein
LDALKSAAFRSQFKSDRSNLANDNVILTFI